MRNYKGFLALSLVFFMVGNVQSSDRRNSSKSALYDAQFAKEAQNAVISDIQLLLPKVMSWRALSWNLRRQQTSLVFFHGSIRGPARSTAGRRRAAHRTGGAARRGRSNARRFLRPACACPFAAPTTHRLQIECAELGAAFSLWCWR